MNCRSSTCLERGVVGALFVGGVRDPRGMRGAGAPRFVALAMPELGGPGVEALLVITFDVEPFVVVERNEVVVWLGCVALVAVELERAEESVGLLLLVDEVGSCGVGVVGWDRWCVVGNDAGYVDVWGPTSGWPKLKTCDKEEEGRVTFKCLHLCVILGSRGE